MGTALHRNKSNNTDYGLPHDPSTFAIWGWNSFAVVNDKKKSHLIGEILSDIAAERQKEPFDVLVDLFFEGESEMIVSEGSMSEKDMKLAMRQDWLIFSSDSAALAPNIKNPVHPRLFGSFPKVFRKYFQEENLISFVDAVRRITSLPADFLLMKDRDFLVEGNKADIVIFNPEYIRDEAIFLDPHQYSIGIDCVIINGKIAIKKGEYNGVLNGRALALT